jgi:superfamily I DNA/RNA helicase
MAYQNLRSGVPCYVEGRDIGKSLLDLIKKFPNARSLSTLSAELANYREEQSAKYTARKQYDKLERLNERIDSLECVIDSLPPGSSVEDIAASVDRVFKNADDRGTPQCLVLSTIHKAKGREWDTVYLLGPNQYMPSKFAQKSSQQWMMEQEDNLMYVAITRARTELYNVMV